MKFRTGYLPVNYGVSFFLVRIRPMYGESLINI